jgi:hypothetical protein
MGQGDQSSQAFDHPSEGGEEAAATRMAREAQTSNEEQRQEYIRKHVESKERTSAQLKALKESIHGKSIAGKIVHALPSSGEKDSEVFVRLQTELLREAEEAEKEGKSVETQKKMRQAVERTYLASEAADEGEESHERAA